MGTRIAVELWHDDAAKGEAAIDAVMAEMRRIDALMSHYKPDSQISKINARAAEEPVVVDRELFDLLEGGRAFFGGHRGRLRHHLCQRRLSLRLPPAREAD